MSVHLGTFQLFSAISVAGTIAAIPRSGEMVEACTIYIAFGPGTSAGVVTVEESHSATYIGSWFSNGAIGWAAANKVESLTIPYCFLRRRIRISTGIVGGSIDAWVVLGGG